MKQINLLSLLIFVLSVAGPAFSENLVPQDEFTKSKTGGPEGWQPIIDGEDWMVRRCKVKQEDGRTFVRINQNPAGLKFDQPVQSTWENVELAFDSRRTDIQPGEKPWEVPLVAVDFLDTDGNSLLNFEKNVWMPDNSDGWENIQKSYAVPEQAVTMRVVVDYKAKAGTADFSNLTIKAIDSEGGEEPE